jgi:hypothetical protein
MHAHDSLIILCEVYPLFIITRLTLSFIIMRLTISFVITRLTLSFVIMFMIYALQFKLYNLLFANYAFFKQ